MAIESAAGSRALFATPAPSFARSLGPLSSPLRPAAFESEASLGGDFGALADVQLASPLGGRSRPMAGLSARRVASLGVAGRGERFPHLARIQPLFGAHDLSGAEAFTGDRAEEACEALGAGGMTVGDRVAFPGRPSLHTAAHEAAHLIQQRRGLRLPGGMGQVGDAFERQADAVADRVVSGRSAAPLLGVAATGGATASAGGAPPIQLTKIKPGSPGDVAATKGAKLFNDFMKETDALDPKVTKYAGDLQANKTTYAEEKALGFVEWSKSATQASQRYYAEWKAAESADLLGSAFGRSDITDPDVTINLTGPSRKRALEVKQVDSATVGNVDEHVEKGVEQLKKRRKTSQLGNLPYDEHALEIFIQSDDNTFPFTQTEWTKAGSAATSAQVEAQFKKRFAKKKKTAVQAKAAPTGQPMDFTFHSPLWPTTSFNF